MGHGIAWAGSTWTPGGWFPWPGPCPRNHVVDIFHHAEQDGGYDAPRIKSYNYASAFIGFDPMMPLPSVTHGVLKGGVVDGSLPLPVTPMPPTPAATRSYSSLPMPSSTVAMPILGVFSADPTICRRLHAMGHVMPCCARPKTATPGRGTAGYTASVGAVQVQSAAGTRHHCRVALQCGDAGDMSWPGAGRLGNGAKGAEKFTFPTTVP